MTKMKKQFTIKILAVFALATMTLPSCKKYLEEKPYDIISPENLQSSPEGVKQMVTGMYGVFFNAAMFANESWMYLTFCDNEWTDGVEWVMGTYGVGNFTGGWMYNNAGNDPYYVFYRLVRAANGVLDVLPKAKFSPEETYLKTQYEGEALTLRSMAYFFLVQMYGALPLHLHTDDPATMPRKPIKDIYAQILKDLHEAEGKLLLNSKRPSNIPRGHFTKGAAQLLLAKVYNTMGSGSLAGGQVTVPIRITHMPDSSIVRQEIHVAKNKVAGYDFDTKAAYDSASAVVRRLIATREYEMESYANTWNPKNFGGKDFIFALETDSAYTPTTTKFNMFITPVGLKGSGWLHYTKDLYYLYEPTDERALYGIAHEYKSSNLLPNGVWMRNFFPAEDSMYYWQLYGKGNALPDITSNSCYLMKWYLGNTESPTVNLNGDNASAVVTAPTQNYPFLRYTEAFFILAEAENEAHGPSAEIFDALDLIKSYRFQPGFTPVDRSMNQEQLRSYILEERTREFIGEDYRRFDLIRWGIYLEVMNAVGIRKPYTDSDMQSISKKREQKHLLYPVPTTEIDGNTAFGPNNPGW